MTVRPDRALIALLAGFAILAATVLGAAWLAQTQQQASGWVRHTLEVENRLSTLMSHVQDAETGERGYLLTGEPDYLEPYNRALGQIGRDLDGLQAATADNPRQQAALAQLRPITEARLALLKLGIDRFRQGDSIAAVGAMRAGRGRLMMERLRQSIASMKGEEARLLAQRSADATRESQLVVLGLMVSFMVVLVLGGFVYRETGRRLAAAVEARDSLATANASLRSEAEHREQAESQLRQMQKMESIGQLTGGVAHDFNNMLAIVVGSLDLAKRRLAAEGDPRVRECIDNAMDGARRAAQLTARLLAFSRQQPLEPRTLDLNKVVGGMSELLRRTIGEQLRVETVLAGGLWRVRADPSEMESAVLNLCVNARDAMPEGGRLTIETSNAHLDDAYAAVHAEVHAGQYVMVSVTDTGTGMPAEVIERAFDPFYTTKGAGRGTGLGLSQVHGFIKQSGGHVKIYSEPGVGTTVKLYLPRYFGADDPMSATILPTSVLPRAKDDEIVLVVEDEERVRHLSVDALRELGYTVVQAADASQALAVLAMQPRVDMLFTDVVMPDMDGRRLADQARASRPGLKILYTTGYTRNAIVHNGVLDPDVAFVAKPFTIDQLARKVRQVLDGETSA